MILALTLTDDEFHLLNRESVRTRRVVEDLLEMVIHTYIATLPGYTPPRSPEQQELLQRVIGASLRENAELYRRLANS